MKKPYSLPFLPVEFDSETELFFYKKVVTASAKLEKLKEKLRYSAVNQSFLELITLMESVQSTRIEGTQVTFHDMLEDHHDDWERIEVRNYQEALAIGIESAQTGYPLSERLIRQIHEVLMKDARSSSGAAGNYRRIQNFISPTNQLKDAAYIPPEPQLMDRYMTNLERFINGNPYGEELLDELHPLIKAAIVISSLCAKHL